MSASTTRDNYESKELVIVEENVKQLSEHPDWVFMLKHSRYGDIRNRVKRLYTIRALTISACRGFLSYVDGKIKLQLSGAILAELDARKVVLITSIKSADLFINGLSLHMEVNNDTRRPTLCFSPDCPLEWLRNKTVALHRTYSIVDPPHIDAIDVCDEKYIGKRKLFHDIDTLHESITSEFADIRGNFVGDMHDVRMEIIRNMYARTFGKYYVNASKMDDIIAPSDVCLGFDDTTVTHINDMTPVRFAAYTKALGDMPLMDTYKEYASLLFAVTAKDKNYNWVSTGSPCIDILTYERFVMLYNQLIEDVGKDSINEINQTIERIVLASKKYRHPLNPIPLPYGMLE